MGMRARIGRVLDSLFETVRGEKQTTTKTDRGGGDTASGPQYGPAGVLSRPLVQDLSLEVPIDGEGRTVVIAFSDPTSGQDAEPGEVVIYSRNGSGERVASIKLKAGGGVEVTSSADTNINGVLIKSDGSVEVPASLKVAGKELAGHSHNYYWNDGPGSDVTGGNN